MRRSYLEIWRSGDVGFDDLAISVTGCSAALVASVTAKIAAAGASVHGKRDSSLMSAASLSIVPQVGTVSGNPSPR